MRFFSAACLSFTLSIFGLFHAPAIAQEAEYVSIIDVPATATEATPAEGASVAALPPVASQGAPMSQMEKEINERLTYLKPTVNVSNIPSLFFSVWEHDLVTDARRGLTTRSDEGGMMAAGPRDVSLGGIVYVSSADWTIWLNNTRITPDAIPGEIMDLKVFKEHIDLEWFDSSTNQIYPIRLRSHQRFNLDTRIFLPG